MVWMSTYKKRKKTTLKIDPESSALYEELCDVYRKVGIEIRMEVGYFAGGICLMDDHKTLFINKNNPIEQNIDMLLEQLKIVNLENIYLSPRLRSRIEAIDTTIEV
jgi:hypothetical protein